MLAILSLSGHLGAGWPMSSACLPRMVYTVFLRARQQALIT